MKKYLKNLLILCLTCCLAACLGIFAACTDTDDGNTDDGNNDIPSGYFQVTVLLADGTPAAGVTVNMCDPAGTENGVCVVGRTDSNGIAQSNVSGLAGDIVEIHLFVIPEGYAYVDEDGNEFDSESGLQFNVSVKKATITLAVAEDEGDDGDNEEGDTTTVTVETVNDTLTVGTVYNFDITLVSISDKRGDTSYLAWNKALYLSFNVENAGYYKITFTSSFENEQAMTYIYAWTGEVGTSGTVIPGYPDEDDNSIFYIETGATDYTYILTFPQQAVATAGYDSDFSAGDTIHYSVLIEETNYESTEATGTLILGETTVSAGTYVYTPEEDGSYTVSVSSADAAMGDEEAWLVNNVPVSDVSYTVTVEDGKTITVVVYGDCTITLAKAD